MWTPLPRLAPALLTVVATLSGLPSSTVAQECPASMTYGDPSHPNSFTFVHENGAERVLHFERVAVSIDADGVHTFHVPQFGSPNVRPAMVLELRSSPAADDAYSVTMFAGGVTPSDCMRILPEVRQWSWLDTSMNVRHFEAPGAGPGRFTAEIRMLQRGDAPVGMIARIDTEHVTVLSTTSADARGMRLETTGDGASDMVAIGGGTAVFHEAAGILQIRVTAGDGHLREMSIEGVRGAPQIIAHESGSLVWDVQELSAGGLVVDEYRRAVVVSEPTTDPLLERPRTPPVADLAGAVLTGRYEIPAVIILPDLAFLRIGDAPPITVSPKGEPLVFDDLPMAAPRDLARPASGRKYFSYYPDHDLSLPAYTEILAPGDASPFTLQILGGIVRPEGTAAVTGPEPESEAVMPAELAEVAEIMGGIFDVLMGPGDEAAKVALVGGILEKRGVTLDRAVTEADLEALSDGEVPFFLAAYDADLVARAFMLQMERLDAQLQAMYDEYFTPDPYEATLDLDEMGAPLRRRLTQSNTSFDVQYRDGVAFITATNEAQGTDTLTVRLPAGVHDLLQWNDVLSRLPLRDGFERTLTFFDLDVYSGHSSGLGPDGEGYSRRYVRAAPVYVTATLSVTGRQTVEIEGEPVAAYRVEVHFNGMPGHPVMSVLGPDLNAKGREGEPLIYLLSVAEPHRVLQADWRATVVQRVLH
jgi:hypothetical protein